MEHTIENIVDPVGNLRKKSDPNRRKHLINMKNDESDLEEMLHSIWKNYESKLLAESFE